MISLCNFHIIGHLYDTFPHIFFTDSLVYLDNLYVNFTINVHGLSSFHRNKLKFIDGYIGKFNCWLKRYIRYITGDYKTDFKIYFNFDYKFK